MEQNLLPPEPGTSLESHPERVVMVMTTLGYSSIDLPLLRHQIEALLHLHLLHLQVSPAGGGDTVPGLAPKTEGEGGLSLVRQENTVF